MTGPVVRWVVQSDVWLDGAAPYSQGAVFIKAGTLVGIAAGQDALAQRYGGWGNLAPEPSWAREGAAEGADRAGLSN